MVEATIENTLTNTVLKVFSGKDIDVFKIVVFGSFGKGNENNNSDIDILIVSSVYRDLGLFERVDISSGVNKALVEAMNRPVDTVYYSDTEWDDDASLIIREAKRYGEVIYDAEAA